MPRLARDLALIGHTSDRAMLRLGLFDLKATLAATGLGLLRSLTVGRLRRALGGRTRGGPDYL